MNYQSNITKFQNQLEKETDKLFKMHDKEKDLLEIENQQEKVRNLNIIVESLKNLIK